MRGISRHDLSFACAVAPLFMDAIVGVRPFGVVDDKGDIYRCRAVINVGSNDQVDSSNLHSAFCYQSLKLATCKLTFPALIMKADMFDATRSFTAKTLKRPYN